MNAAHAKLSALRPIFIGGMPRSGTTLMQRLLDGHPQLLVYPLEDCILRDFSFPVVADAGIVGTLDGMVARDARQIGHSLLQSPKFNAFYQLFDPGIAAADEDVVRRLPADRASLTMAFDAFGIEENQRLFEELLSEVPGPWNIRDVFQSWVFAFLQLTRDRDLSGKTAWVTKCPDRGRCIRCQIASFPDCRIVHLVRDPRGFYLSYVGDKSLRGLQYLVDQYRISCGTADAAHRDRPRNILLVRYEDLVTATRATMRRVAAFLDLEFTESLLTPTLMGGPCRANSTFAAEGAQYAISSEPVDRWRARLRWREKTLIDLLLRNELRRHGYVV